MSTIIKCKMCGGDLTLSQGSTLAVCEYCGTTQTVPNADSEKKLVQFERAERLRRNCDFDKAAGVYESIVSEFRQEAEAYWGLVLCKYGIEYVDDPATGKKIPTCHRTSFESVMDDSNFDQTLENADAASRKVYRQEAKIIEEIRKGIIEVSSAEAPYDIFICYKETAEDGQRTIDSVLAQDLYEVLTQKGYRTFFSRISLEDKIGQAYEPYIFAALNSARVMLAIGTDYEYFNAVWVKNEWSRYLKLMEQDKTKHLIPCFKGIDAYDMPKEFSKLQAQDLGKVGAVQDLIRGIDKLLGVKKQETVTVSGGNLVAETLDKAYGFLRMGEWESAALTLDTVRGLEPDNVKMLIGRLMCDCKVTAEEKLAEHTAPLDDNANYQQALRFADSDTKKRLERYNHSATYRMAMEKGGQKNLASVTQAIELLRGIQGFQDADEQITRLAAIQKKLKNKAKGRILTAVAVASAAVLVAGFLVLKKNYLDPMAIYKDAVALMESGDYTAAEEKFAELNAFNNSSDMILQCRYRYAEALMEQELYRDAAAVFKDLGEYSDSQTRRLESYYRLGEKAWQEGSLAAAEKYFKWAEDYEDAADRAIEAEKESVYRSGLESMEKESYNTAVTTFEKILDYKDSQDLYIKACFARAEKVEVSKAMQFYKKLLKLEHEETTARVNQILEAYYQEAESLLSQKKTQSARDMFTFLSVVPYKDSADRKFAVKDQIEAEKNAINGIWYSSDAWFDGAIMWIDNGYWAWDDGTSASVMDDYVSGKYKGSKLSYDADTKVYTLSTTKYSNGEKEYLTAKLVNGKLVVTSTNPDEAFYPGHYKKIKSVD